MRKNHHLIVTAVRASVVLLSLLTTSPSQAQLLCDADAAAAKEEVAPAPFGNLPPIRRKVTVPGHENEVCITYNIPDIRDPRYDTYCEWTHTDCYDPETGFYTYFSGTDYSCREWPTEPLPVPDRAECTGEAGGPEKERDYLSCEENAHRASFNCMQEAHCNFGIGLIECHNLPPGHGFRENCYSRTSEQLRDAIYECQVAYSNAISACATTWPDHRRQNACMRRAARLREMAELNCVWIRVPGEVASCFQASEDEYNRRVRACLASD